MIPKTHKSLSRHTQQQSALEDCHLISLTWHFRFVWGYKKWISLIKLINFIIQHLQYPEHESRLCDCQSLPEDADVPGKCGEEGRAGGGGVDKGEGAYNQDLKTLFHIF